MDEPHLATANTKPEAQSSLPIVVLLFIGSGCAALIYEVVWFQLLSLVIGSSSVSLGILLGTFMGGMCLGSMFLPKVVSPSHHPLRVYAFLEIGIGVIGVVVLLMMPLVGSIYTNWSGAGVLGMALRGIVTAFCLLPPTILMGATLPAISRWVKTTQEGVSWLGFFYGGNIIGAVLGTLIAGFFLLRTYDVFVATFVAVGINILVALLSLILAKAGTIYEPPPIGEDSPKKVSASVPIYITIALSGLTALGAEVIWTRQLSLLFGATVYTFSLILAVFLFGLGIGTSLGSLIARSVKNVRLALGYCQLLLCAAMAWAAYSMIKSLPFWPLDLTLLNDPWIGLQLDMARAVWTMLPATLLWGTSFPLALAAAAEGNQDPGRLVGRLYAANTFGAIIGALSSGLLLVALIGSRHALQLFILLSAISGLLMFVDDFSRNKNKWVSVRSAILVGTTIMCVAFLFFSVPELGSGFIAHGRFLPTLGYEPNVIYVGEGVTATVAVSEEENGIRNYHNAGKIQASSYPEDMRLQRMLGHLTTLVAKNPETFLVIGCGAGVTAGAVSINPELERTTIVEIEPLVPEIVSTYFGEENYEVVNNPRVDIRIDDGRHFLLTTDQKFDGITSDPLDPWVKGAAALYTREFWQLAKDHLKPGGVVTVFVQLYETTEEAVKSEVATFLEVFPNGAVFANTVDGEGYDLVLLGRSGTDPIDLDQVQQRLDSPDYALVRQSLAEVGFYSAVDLFSTFAGQAPDLAKWLEGASINRDRNLRLQYLAGQGLNFYLAETIFNKMVASGIRFPKQLFIGSPAIMQALRESILYQQGRF